MNQKISNILIGTTYFIILIVIFWQVLNIIARLTNAMIRDGALKFIIIMILSGLVLHFATIKKINYLLKPNKIKIITSLIIFFIAYGLVLLNALGQIHINYYIVHIITFYSISFSGIFEFMEFLFPLIIYYLIICLIYQAIPKTKDKSENGRA